MFGFFTVKTEPVTPVARPVGSFSYRNTEHLVYLEQQMDRFEARLSAMRWLDQQLVGAFTLAGLCTYGLSSWWLMPSLGLLSACYLTYLYPQRGPAFEQYRELLMELKRDYLWAMGSGGSKYHELGCKSIQRMLRLLGPLLAQEDVVTWQDSDLENSVFSLSQRNPLPEECKLLLQQLKKGDARFDLTKKIYGEKGVADFLPVLKQMSLNLIPDSVRGLFSYRAIAAPSGN
ncbi:MAG: hypothetical protein JJT82_01525 [Legionellaceae bacterium]|nr:hypothetical protein [Legionellaceae bacterium]